jgi:hypothetical protein
LHLAAKLGNLKIAQRLLREGDATSGLTLQDSRGKLPVDYALASKFIDLELIEVLSPPSTPAADEVADEGSLASGKLPTLLVQLHACIPS